MEHGYASGSATQVLSAQAGFQVLTTVEAWALSRGGVAVRQVDLPVLLEGLPLVELKSGCLGCLCRLAPLLMRV